MARALVVGASDGIGLGTARRLLDEGWDVATVSRRPTPIDHPRHTSLVADVTDVGYRAALAAFLGDQRSTERRDERELDLCVYCAGVGDRLDVAKMALEHEVFAVNLLGAVATAEVVFPRFVAARRGHFVALSSLADTLISGETPSYNASKAGLSNWLAGMRLAMRRHGVSVTNVRFGFVDTKMAKSDAKPFMMSVERAVDHVRRAIDRRPATLSRPWPMIALVALLAWAVRVKSAFGG